MGYWSIDYVIARVGKTSLTVRFCNNLFDENQPSTLDASCLEKAVTLTGGGSIKLVIWDTAGQERYHALNPVYYRGAEGKYLNNDHARNQLCVELIKTWWGDRE